MIPSRWRAWITGGVIVALLAVIGYDQIRMHRTPVEYRLDIATEDFRINNINLVASANHVYLAGGWFLELTGGNPAVDHIVIDGRAGGTRLLDMATGEPFLRSDVMPITNGSVFDGLSLSDRSVLQLRITYTVDGRSKTYEDKLLLGDSRKPFAETGRPEYKLYEIRPRETVMR
ncbi:hypothetical protein [Paenibacillus tepidiphilus]|uniref:hypothetical protein n=1 Tax=Paenibacillus tepidiphilus TaxID=2608683 RepID=UPI00123A58DD|nr:hypothetical protein [Paenibacillus tepidiphilus]